jgi:signal transduction histidine kinase
LNDSSLSAESPIPSSTPELERELRVKLALETSQSTPSFILGQVFVLANLAYIFGNRLLAFPVVIPLVLLLAVTIVNFRSYLRIRKKARPSDVSSRRIQLIYLMTLVISLSWTALIFLLLLGATALEQMILLVVAISLTYPFVRFSSRLYVQVFILPVLLGTMGAMIWIGDIPWLFLVIFGAGTMVFLTQFSARVAQESIASIEQAIESNRVLQDRFEAEEKLRLAEIAAANAAHERQAEKNAMQRNFIDAVAFPMILSEGSEMVQMTAAGAAQFKVPDGEIDTVDPSDLFVDREDQKRLYSVVEAEGRVDNFEVLMQDTEGKQFWSVVSMQPLNYDGKDCWLSSIYVIDARKRMEQDLSVAKEAAEQALTDLQTAQESLVHAEKMASLGQLTAGIAHEIKNPLNFVNNFSRLSVEMIEELAELLKDPIASLDEEGRDDAEDLIETVRGNLQKIDEHGKRADSIVKNMLLHSRQGGADKQTVSLNELTQEAMKLAYHGARAADSSFNVDLKSLLAEDVGNVSCQPQDLQRVILNLCSNGMYEAVKNASSGGDAAILTVSSYTSDGSYMVDISDSGKGVPENIRDKIFQPFFTTKPTGEGTGLGLSMSYDIIKQHGGDLSLVSEEGKGATFRIRLPMALAT